MEITFSPGAKSDIAFWKKTGDVIVMKHIAKLVLRQKVWGTKIIMLLYMPNTLVINYFTPRLSLDADALKGVDFIYPYVLAKNPKGFKRKLFLERPRACQ